MDKYKLLKNIVNSEKINELFELLDESLVVISNPSLLALNKDKHKVYRLFDKGELTVVEEFIPKKDDAGNWIDFEYPPRSKFKIVDLDSDFLPKEINYHYILESILARIKERIDFNKEYVFYEDDIKELEEYLGGILDKIKNEIVITN